MRDVARFAVQLMESEVSSQRFILSAESWPYRKLMETIAAALGARPPRFKATPLLLGLAWRAAWLHSKITGQAPLLTKETAMNASLSFHYDNRKSIEQFDFHYTPVQQTVAETARQFLEAQAERSLPARVLPFDTIC